MAFTECFVFCFSVTLGTCSPNPPNRSSCIGGYNSNFLAVSMLTTKEYLDKERTSTSIGFLPLKGPAQLANQPIAQYYSTDLQLQVTLWIYAQISHFPPRLVFFCFKAAFSKQIRFDDKNELDPI